MLSRAEYRGRLPYEEYVRRHKMRENAHRERMKELGQEEEPSRPIAIPVKKNL